MTKRAVILLSAGLDSTVSLYLAREFLDVVLALTFDYGQRASNDEINASKKIAEKFNIEHKVIKLPFLAEMTNTALVCANKNLEFETLDEKSMEAVWVPNRNGLFFNIAGVYADSLKLDYIIYGGNIEEAGTFSDNSPEFTEIANEFFTYSTLSHPKVIAPCAKMTKKEIIEAGIKAGVDFSLIKSCYKVGVKHCGKCESCRRLKSALLELGNKSLINLMF